MIATRFDYSPLNGSGKNVQAVADQIKTLSLKFDEASKTTVETAMKIGELLTSVKETIGHGLWEHWLSMEFGWSLRSARNFMAIHEKFKSAIIADLPLTVLYLLAGDSVPREAVEEVKSLANDGEKVTVAKAKSIVAKHKPDREKPVSVDKKPAKPLVNRIADSIQQTYEPPNTVEHPVVEYAPPAVAQRSDEPAPIVGEWKPVKKKVLVIGADKMGDVRELLLAARELGEEDFQSLIRSIDADLVVLKKIDEKKPSQEVDATGSDRVVSTAKNIQEIPDTQAPHSKSISRQTRSDSLVEFDPMDLKPAESLDTPKFKERWKRWVIYNRDEGHPLSQMVAESQLKTLGRRSLEQAINAIDIAISKRMKVFPDVRESREKFTAPTLEEVTAYIEEKELTSKVNPSRFYDWYEARGWTLSNGKKLVDWKAAIRTWASRDECARSKQEPQSTEIIDGAYEVRNPGRRRPSGTQSRKSD